MQPRVLVIGFSQQAALLSQSLLAGSWRRVEGMDAALRLADPQDFDILILEAPDQRAAALRAVGRLRAEAPLIPHLVLVRAWDEELAVEAVAAGAQDCLAITTLDADALRCAMRMARARHRLWREQGGETRHLQELRLRHRQHLTIAERVQRSLLPTDLPRVAGVDLAWRYRPAERLSGDIINAFPVGDDHLAFYLLDVSGHGVAAALLAVQLSRVLHPGSGEHVRSALDLKRPAHVLEALNEQFPMSRNGGQYFTIVYGVLHLPSCRVTLCAAGHPPSLLVRDGTWSENRVRGLPVGWLPDSRWPEEELTLRVGDRLVLYSDGLTEAVDHEREEGEEFGRERLGRLLAATQGRDLQAALDEVMAAQDRWRGSHPPRDDCTVLALEVTASSRCASD